MAGSKKKVAVVAPVAVVQDKKSAKKGGKREAEVAVEKVVSAKKPKLVKEEALAAKKKVEAAKKKVVEKEETSSEEVEDESDSEEEAPAAAVAPKKKGSVPAVTKKVESSDEEGSEDDDSSEEEEEAATEAAAEDDDSEEDDSDDSEEEDEEMADAATPASKKATAVQPKTPGTQENAGSKTLFIGNLSFNAEKENVEEFFKEVAEATAVRFVSAPDGTFKGFGYVEFASVEDAQKALTLNGGDLLGRPVKLDLARERGSDTPNTRDSSNKAAEGTSVFIRGFDKSLDEDTIRSSLEEHFGECGEITRVSIPTDRDTGSSKGIAYVDFTKTAEVAKALELSGSDMGGFSLFVDCAKPKPDFGSGGGRGFGSGGGRGGFRGGRGGDRGGRRGRGGDRGGGRRGGGRGRRGGY